MQMGSGPLRFVAQDRFDLRELLLGKLRPVERAKVFFELADRAGAEQGGSNRRQSQYPCDGHLRQRLAASPGDCVQFPNSREIGADLIRFQKTVPCRARLGRDFFEVTACELALGER